MFNHLSLKQLRKLISDYRAYHNIKNSSKMKKIQLVQELDKRFMLKDNKIYLKADVPASSHSTAVGTERRRIAPILVSQPTANPQVHPNFNPPISQNPFNPLENAPSRTAGQKRYDETVNRIEKNYTTLGGKDANPRWAF